MATKEFCADQYNDIADAYAFHYPLDGSPSPLPTTVVEVHQIKRTIAAHQVDLKGKHILDLACGGGFYSFRFLEWGAASVTGCDVSSGQIELARKEAARRGVNASQASFVVGDVTDAELMISNTTGEQGRFDIVFAAWLLNYCPDQATLQKMFDFVGRHLKPGGRFISLTVPPLMTGLAWERDMMEWALSKEGSWGLHGNRGQVIDTRPNHDGYTLHMELGLPERGHPVAAFDCYYLRKDLVEAACRNTGMFDGIEWQPFEIPDEARNAHPTGHWNSLLMYPHCRACTAVRK